MAEATNVGAVAAVDTEQSDATRLARLSAHAFQYRISTAVFGRRFYMTILAGSETRSTRRLRNEGVLRSIWTVACELAIVCLAVSLMICLLTGLAVIALYLAKCVLGVDILDGPSPMHPIYEFVFGR